MKRKLTARKLLGRDNRSDLVRIHYLARDAQKFPRWSLAKLTCKGKSRFVVVLGHDEEPNAIMMDIDHRHSFGVEVGEAADFELTRVGMFGNVRYLLNAHDPMLRLPSLIALISFALGIISLGVTIIPLLVG